MITMLATVFQRLREARAAWRAWRLEIWLTGAWLNERRQVERSADR